jgi:hypothetical protein
LPLFLSNRPPTAQSHPPSTHSLTHSHRIHCLALFGSVNADFVCVEKREVDQHRRGTSILTSDCLTLPVRFRVHRPHHHLMPPSESSQLQTGAHRQTELLTRSQSHSHVHCMTNCCHIHNIVAHSLLSIFFLHTHSSSVTLINALTRTHSHARAQPQSILRESTKWFGSATVSPWLNPHANGQKGIPPVPDCTMIAFSPLMCRLPWCGESVRPVAAKQVHAPPPPPPPHTHTPTPTPTSHPTCAVPPALLWQECTAVGNDRKHAAQSRTWCTHVRSTCDREPRESRTWCTHVRSTCDREPRVKKGKLLAHRLGMSGVGGSH